MGEPEERRKAKETSDKLLDQRRKKRTYRESVVLLVDPLEILLGGSDSQSVQDHVPLGVSELVGLGNVGLRVLDNLRVLGVVGGRAGSLVVEVFDDLRRRGKRGRSDASTR